MESAAHLLSQGLYQLIDERFFLSQESKAITNGTAQDTANHITSSIVGGQLPISNSKGDRPDVVGNHTYRHIDLFLFGGYLDPIGIFCFSNLFYLLDQRCKDVRIIVGLLTL